MNVIGFICFVRSDSTGESYIEGLLTPLTTMKLQSTNKIFTDTHTIFPSCRVSLRLESSTTLIEIVVYAGTSLRRAIYPNVIALIISFLFLLGYKGHFDTGIKQEREKER